MLSAFSMCNDFYVSIKKKSFFNAGNRHILFYIKNQDCAKRERWLVSLEK